MEPAEFLRTHPPFDRLGSEQLRVVEGALQVAYYPRGSTVLRQGGARSRFLYVVRKGTVRLERESRLLQVLEEGECFGFPSMIGQASPHVDVVASDDTLAYQIPEDVFGQLMNAPAFAEFFLADLSARLRQAASIEPLPLDRDLAVPARQLVQRDPLWVDATDSVQHAARVMRDAGVSSVLVHGAAPGILTDRDLRSRVLAEGKGPGTPVGEVMTAPVQAVAADAPLFETLVFMLEHKVHHVPLEDDGRLVGIITDTDMLRLQVKSPLQVLHGLERLDRPEVLASYGAELIAMVEALAAGGLEAAKIGRIVSRLNDTLTAHLLRLAEHEFGPPPAPYAWIVFGSEGRMEQTLITDQDNALVHRGAPDAERYFARLADRVVGGLLSAGFPACTGGFMATNWHRPLAEWEQLFAGWIDTPEPEALRDASSFFDFREVHGGLPLDTLAALLRDAGRKKLFLAHLAKTALRFEPPLSPLRQIRDREGGVDVKRGGIMPIVGLARVYALEAGAEARSTLARLEAAAAAGTLSEQGAGTLGEAFRFLMRIRLRAQLDALRRGTAPGNTVQLEDLSPLERRHLKETFLAIREIQEAAALRFATDRLG